MQASVIENWLKSFRELLYWGDNLSERVLVLYNEKALTEAIYNVLREAKESTLTEIKRESTVVENVIDGIHIPITIIHPSCSKSNNTQLR